jgi:hypothetical protein
MIDAAPLYWSHVNQHACAHRAQRGPGCRDEAP